MTESATTIAEMPEVESALENGAAEPEDPEIARVEDVEVTSVSDSTSAVPPTTQSEAMQDENSRAVDVDDGAGDSSESSKFTEPAASSTVLGMSAPAEVLSLGSSTSTSTSTSTATEQSSSMGNGGGDLVSSDTQSTADPVSTEITTTSPNGEVATSATAGEQDELPITVAASTTPATPAEPLVETVVSKNNYFQFDQSECVRVNDGSYYCGGQTPPTPAEDQFYVALDADGDREIFASINGQSVQITHNRYDDAAPHYDPVSNTLVWHALIDGRYQIMSYNFDTEEQTQLTDGTQNSMEPSRYGSVTAWQQWGEVSWDIVVHDGHTARLVTSDEVADIAPSVQNGLVIWKRIFADEQRVALYNIAEERVLDITEGSLGAAVTNPRMLLVFESHEANGDRVVHGYDPLLRTLVPLNAAPSPLPERLPSSEPTEEVRALVHAKPTIEEEGSDGEVGVKQATSTDDIALAATTASTTATSTVYDLVIPKQVSENSTTTQETIEVLPPTATSSFDLVIPPTASSTAS